MNSSGSGVDIQEIKLYRLCASKVPPVVLHTLQYLNFYLSMGAEVGDHSEIMNHSANQDCGFSRYYRRSPRQCALT